MDDGKPKKLNQSGKWCRKKKNLQKKQQEEIVELSEVCSPFQFRKFAPNADLATRHRLTKQKPGKSAVQCFLVEYFNGILRTYLKNSELERFIWHVAVHSAEKAPLYCGYYKFHVRFFQELISLYVRVLIIDCNFESRFYKNRNISNFGGDLLKHCIWLSQLLGYLLLHNSC